MMASVPIALSGTPTPTNPIAFNTAFDRRGWKSFHGIPAAGETRLDIDSLWASPRFNEIWQSGSGIRPSFSGLVHP